jgi:hypothetical protein
MMEVKNGRIYFHNTLKPELSVLDYKCLSAYICPVCKNVLKAYFVGSILPETLKEYTEKDTMKYAYEMGNTQGGQWISLRSHQHKEVCSWELVGAMSKGINNAIKSFMEIHETSIKDIPKLVQAIESGVMPGFRKVVDETGTDQPMLLFKEIELLDTKGMSFDEKWAHLKNLGKCIDSVLQTISLCGPSLLR